MASQKGFMAYGIAEKVRPPDDVVVAETNTQTDIALLQWIQDTILELCGGKVVVNELKNLIMQKTGLDQLNLRETLDESLQHHPPDGWNDIIKNEVEKKVTGLHLDSDTRELILQRIKEHLTSETTD